MNLNSEQDESYSEEILQIIAFYESKKEVRITFNCFVSFSQKTKG